jgi:hypothetical protein
MAEWILVVLILVMVGPVGGIRMESFPPQPAINDTVNTVTAGSTLRRVSILDKVPPARKHFNRRTCARRQRAMATVDMLHV